MKQNRSFPLRQLLLVLLIATVPMAAHIAPSEAKRSHSKKASKSYKHPKRHHGRHPKGGHITPAPPPPPGQGSDQPSDLPNVFDLLSYGAKGDVRGSGGTDRTSEKQALVAAWKAACSVQLATLRIPPELKFLVKPVTLHGPCASDIVLQIDGTLLAPRRIGSWPKSSRYQWLNFKWVNNFTIRGTGTVDGQGSNWWTWSLSDQMYSINQQRKMKHVPDMKPTCHLKFDSSDGVMVTNVTISSPDSSPNTDGIHLQNTRDAEIEHSNIGCGDDCVSIQTGCSNVHVHHINCGPGHGISLGGLGKDKSMACVSNVTVENLSLQSTMYGLRIKTWQGGAGSVRNVSFSNVRVSEVKVPIAIDQYYCDKGHCKNQSEAVAVSGVKFDSVVGTYASQPVYLACSHDVPCTDVDMVGVQLTPASNSGGLREALCYNSYGKSTGPLLPSSMDGCLRSQSDFLRRIARSHDRGCW
ncbi:hypothetical protein SAY87_016891 [Trapa incisa]|uniref:Polygalacturonase n=1 Tax=Trapa incisa TaxID=236973 RepID=A0AAN7QYF6_9MYRT|nr:hypothetical protein SAY87_016891 [Trapa incisa]